MWGGGVLGKKTRRRVAKGRMMEERLAGPGEDGLTLEAEEGKEWKKDTERDEANRQGSDKRSLGTNDQTDTRPKLPNIMRDLGCIEGRGRTAGNIGRGGGGE